MSVFVCRRCGHCCMGRGGIVLGPKDKTRLAQHLNLSEAEMLERVAESRNGKYVLRVRELSANEVPQAAQGEDQHNYACLFFVPGKGCEAHPARPDVCRAWPFFRGNLEDPVSLEMAKADCPGIMEHVTHADFVRQGLAFIDEHGLASPDGPANALRIGGGEGKDNAPR